MIDNSKCINYNFKFNVKKIKENKILRLKKNEILDVIIIGAGASGIAAANYLQQNGKKVLILEARNRIGGRIHDTYIKGFGKIPLGAAWLHYKQNAWPSYHNDNHVIKDLLNEYNVEYVKSKGLDNKFDMKMYDSKGNLFSDKESLQLLNDLPRLIC